MKGLKLERVAKSNEVSHGCRRQAEAPVKVELLVGRNPKSCSEMQDLLRPAMFRKGPGVLEKGVPSIDDLSIDQKSALATEVASSALGWPQQRKHTRGGPFLGERMRPG